MPKFNKSKAVEIEGRMSGLKKYLEHEVIECLNQWSELSQQITTLANLIKGKAMANDLPPHVFNNNGEEPSKGE